MWRVQKIPYKIFYRNEFRFSPRYQSVGPNSPILIHDVCNKKCVENTPNKNVPKKSLNVVKRSLLLATLEPQDVKLPESCHVVKTFKKKILSFDEVPGPQISRYIANIWKYFPAAGTQITRSFMIYVLRAGPQLKIYNKTKFLSFLFDEYGPVVRVTGPFGGDVVLLNRPEHMQNVFNQDGLFPVCSAFDSLENYRSKYRNFQFSGLYSIEGEKWRRQRDQLDLSLSISFSDINENVDSTCNKFINFIKKLRNHQDEVPFGFQQTIFKWSLECMGHVLFRESYGLLEPNIPPKEDTVLLEESLRKASKSLAACEGGLQLWKLLDTPHWKQLIESFNTLDSLIGQQIKQTEIDLHREKIEENDRGPSGYFDPTDTTRNNLSEKNSPTLIRTMLANKLMEPEDILTTFIDMLIIGVNASTSAMSFILYHLAKSQRAQKKLFEELVAVERLDFESTFSHLKKMPYLQACVKESLRLVPPFPVITRVLKNNVVIDGFRIPRGSNMVMATQILGLREENFDDAKRFYPDRWLHPDAKEFHPLATLPFGHGIRKCIAENLSEMMLLVSTAELVRNFKIEYHYGDIKAKTDLVSLPNRPLRFRFVNRE